MKLVASMYLLLLLSSVAHAQGEAVYSGRSSIGVLFIPKAECVATLQDLFQPEETIKEGLTILLSGGEDESRKLGCASTIVTGWDREFSTPPFIHFDPSVFYRRADLEPKQKRLAELHRQIRCHNPYPPNSPDHKWYAVDLKTICAGKWLSKEEIEGPKKEYENLREEIRELEKAWSKRQEQRRSLAEILAGTKPDRTKLDELYKQYRCYNRYSPGSADHKYYEQNYSAGCAGKWLSKEEGDKLKAELEVESKIYSAQENTYYREVGRISEMVKDREYELDPEVSAAVDALYCSNRFAPATSSYNWLRQTRGAACEGKWIDSERAAALESEIRARFQNLEERLAKWKASFEERSKTLRKEIDQKNMEYHRNYNLRRLLARFHAVGKKKKDLDLESFCAEYESLQNRDKKYAEQKFEFKPFREEEEWELAQEHGLTEGEMSAIRAYTGSFYSVINPAIWGGRITAREEIYLDMINAGLDRLPAYKAGPVVRETKLPPEVVAEHEVGAIVTYKAYTSTSKKKNWRWGDGSGHRFVIYGGRDGKNVERISSSPGEEEILFKAGTRFKVLSKKPRKEGSNLFEFVLAEVDAEGNLLAELPKPKAKPEVPKSKPLAPKAKKQGKSGT